MSQNQSRAERSESSQYRKIVRSSNSNQQHQFGSGKGGGGSSASTIPFNRSFKKNNNNAQGGQSRERNPNASSDSCNSSLAPPVQNGAHQQQPPLRVSDAHVSSTTVSGNKPDVPNPKITQAVPRVPSSNVSTASPTSNVSTAISDSQAMTTSAKAPGDASRSFPLQFGSISPGFMNGMPIPARTSSCPPNLDEQKKNQARHEALLAVPTMPGPSLPKHHLAKNEARILDQPNAGGAQLMPKSKRDTQVSSALPVSQTQKSPVHSIPAMPMQLPFHQPQVPVHFGGPNPQIQSQPMTGTSLPMPMPMPMALTMGNPSVQQPLFVSGLPPHPMQSQGMMHQGQSLNFSSQMGPQMLPQLGNMGINMAPQFPQQQVGKYTASRKTVKITHPETHEELRLDGSPGLRSHSNMPPQSQPIPSFPPNHPMSYYSNSYNATSLFFPSVSSVPLNSTQAPPQPPRFYNQVTIKPAGGSHGVKDPLLPTSSPSVEKGDSSKVLRSHGEGFVGLQKEFESSSSSSLQPSKRISDATTASAIVSGPIDVKNDVPNTASSASAIIDNSASISCSSAEEARNGSNILIESVNDKNRKPDNRCQQHQVDERSTSLLSLVSQLPGAEALAAKSSSTIMVSETSKDRFSSTLPVASEDFTITCEGAGEGKTQELSKSLGTKGVRNRQSKPEIMGRKEQGDTILSESSKPYNHSLETSLKPLSTNVKVEEISDQGVTSFADGSFAHAQRKPEESLGYRFDDVKVADNVITSTCMIDGGNVGSSMRVNDLSKQDDKTTFSDASVSSLPDSIGVGETTGTKSDVVDFECSAVVVPMPSEGAMKEENEDIENNNSGLASLSLSSVKEKALSESNAARSTVARGKKKRRELYRKAEAAGTSSDLYMAYKGPEERKETEISAESVEITSSIGIKQTCVIASQKTAVPSNESAPSKVEPDDWEDAAEISTPQLETLRDKNEGDDGDGIGVMTNRYSRDFLLKFSEQCPDLPENFEITSDIVDVLMVSSANVLREPYPSPGRNIDRPIGGSRPERRGTGMGEEDKWSKLTGPLMSGRGDVWTDVGYAGNITGFRPGQVGNYGVLRNPRAVTPLPYAGGILSGLGPQGGLQRYNFDSERWQRGTGFQKGLMHSPLTPLQMMHKAEKKYEVGKVSDEEEIKQRQLKAILNKLTPQNFEKLFEQVKQVNIDNVVTLSGVISQIFDKALMEPTFCEMYANFCFHLAADLPDLSVDNEKITFKRLLLNECQEEFERGEREEEEANKADAEGEDKQTIEEREEKRLQARRRMLGNIKLIGELYKKRMLTERIMHECINKLLGQYQNPDQNPDEENVEALCKLMSTIGEMIDHPIAKEHMDAYFEIMAQLSNNMKLSSRVRFMLRDAIDLRKNKWQQRRKVEGPKKIEEVHRDAAQERHAQGSRLARSPSIGSSVRRGPPLDFAPRVPSMLSSPSSQTGGFRAFPPQLHGSGSQDVRLEAYENRTMSVPLPQRPLGDDSITLGPQGGLARGMAFRGQPSVPNIPVAEVPSPGDARRIGPGLNGFRSMPEQTAYGQREDLIPKYVPERFSSQSVCDQSHPQERSMTYGNRDIRNADRTFDSSVPISPPARGEPHHIMQNISSEKIWPEERLRDMSMATIKEFYSIKDENEVILCIKDLNAPSFYPSMISIWVTDSFERKDVERDLLTRLLINLTKCRETMISEDQLAKGFESVLTILEDTVNDAPRAAEFLGRIFAKVILENVISLSEIGRLIFEGGEEQGRLVEIGLAAEVLGNTLEIVRLEKGDSVLNEILSGSNLRLENFRPPGSNKSWRIDKFL